MPIRDSVLFLLLGFILSAADLSGLHAADELSTVPEQATEAVQVSQAARARFRHSEELVARVSAMTDLIDMAPIISAFTAASDEVAVLLKRLTTFAASERMQALSRSAEAEARQWRVDGEILLGIRPSREVPTIERVTEEARHLRQRLDEIIALAAEDGRACTQASPR